MGTWFEIQCLLVTWQDIMWLRISSSIHTVFSHWLEPDPNNIYTSKVKMHWRYCRSGPYYLEPNAASANIKIQMNDCQYMIKVTAHRQLCTACALRLHHWLWFYAQLLCCIMTKVIHVYEALSDLVTVGLTVKERMIKCLCSAQFVEWIKPTCRTGHISNVPKL